EMFINCCKDFIKGSNIVKLSEEEAYLISNKDTIEGAADYLINLGCKNLVITLGKEGSMLVTKEKKVSIKTKQLEMKDATGAGDAFIGAVLAQILNEPSKNIEEIVKYANLVGGITTTKLGALESIPTWDEVKRYL
ncbi:MAG: carbohydrate kinase family protein, partial [Paraclostridium dentum]|uniref:carbohydrate kinase family protein n=1 Tax=Paraclostridium dentum TaxID=2662455 RepID=UPI003EE4997C